VLLAARLLVTHWGGEQTGALPDRVHWVPPTEAAAAEAATGKPILYEFSAEWCGPCRQMQREMFASEQWARGIDRSVVPVRIVDRSREDGHNTPLVDSLQRVCQVTAFPTLALVADGHIVDRQEGYGGASPTMQWLGSAVMRSGKGPGIHIKLNTPR
jgi:thiol-disulfide isomerase/thioredoxin